MRIRSIKPEFFIHSELYDLEHECGLPVRLAFVGLWCAADRSGRFKWKPRELKLQILPYDPVDFSRVLHALTTRGFVVKYACKLGDEYGFIPSFERHQVINNKEKDSILPSPSAADMQSTRASRVPDASSTRSNLDQGEGKGREGKGKEGRESVPPAHPAQPALPLPSPTGDTGADASAEWEKIEGFTKPQKPEKPKKVRERNPAFDALVEVGGGDPSQVTSSEGGRVAKALSEIRATLPGLSLEDLAAEIRRRAENYRISHPDWELTPSALSGHWSGSNAAERRPDPKARPLGTGSKSAMQENIDQLTKAAEEDMRQLEAARAARIAAGGPQPVPVREKIKW